MSIKISGQTVELTPKKLHDAPVVFSLRGRKVQLQTDNGPIQVSLRSIMKAVRKSNIKPNERESYRQEFIHLKEKGYIPTGDKKAPIKANNRAIQMVSRTLHQLSKRKLKKEFAKLPAAPIEQAKHKPLPKPPIKAFLKSDAPPLFPDTANNTLFFQTAKERNFILTRPLMFVLDKEGRLFSEDAKVADPKQQDMDLYFYKKNARIVEAPSAPNFEGSELYQGYDLEVMTVDQEGNLVPITGDQTEKQNKAIQDLLNDYRTFALQPKGKSFLTQEEANIQFFKKKLKADRFPITCAITPFGQLIPLKNASALDVTVEFNRNSRELIVNDISFFSEYRQESIKEILEHFNKIIE